MKYNYQKNILIFGSIVLLIIAMVIPSISSAPENIRNNENTAIFNDEFSCEITKPTRALYLNDEKIFDFMFIQRGIVLGDISIKVDAVDDVVGIDYVEFYIDTILQDTDYDEPYMFLWDFWMSGLHIIDAIAYNTQGGSVEAEPIQIFKFG